jgi:ribonuclease HII
MSDARRARLTLGIDEAGRGPALGPMVMAAVCLDTRAARALTRAGLRDSKSFGPPARARQTRRALADRVRAAAIYWRVEVVDVAEIDRRVLRGELNVLEREVARRFIAAAPPVDRIVADGKRLFVPLCGEFPHLEARDGGESHHAAVAAASILAKTRRDEIFARIACRYEPIFGALAGGGYVNEPTRRFLRAFAARFGRLPPEARRSWPHPYLDDVLAAENGAP